MLSRRDSGGEPLYAYNSNAGNPTILMTKLPHLLVRREMIRDRLPIHQALTSSYADKLLIVAILLVVTNL